MTVGISFLLVILGSEEDLGKGIDLYITWTTCVVGLNSAVSYIPRTMHGFWSWVLVMLYHDFYSRVGGITKYETWDLVWLIYV